MSDIPSKIKLDSQWTHFELWQRINALFYSLPNHFETELLVKGINVTEVFSVGSAFATIVDSQVVIILNKLRELWDPDNKYANYAFVRQAQTFPDVLLRNLQGERDILFGIELKSWYVLSKEGEPSFRYRVTPEACAEPDLLVVIPWLLSDVIAGTPKLLTPYKDLAKYVAEYRNHYWQESRTARNENANIRKPQEERRHPYPISKQESSASSEDDRGNNFGRIARTGILDEYINNIKAQDYLGVQIRHWIAFFKAISENTSDEQIDRRLASLKNQLQSDAISNSIEHLQYRDTFLGVVERLEELWREIA